MTNEVLKILVEKETVSDEFCNVIELNYSNGDLVKEGDIIGSYETSKAVFDVEAPIDGYFYYNIKVGDKLPVGHVFSIISSTKIKPDEYLSKPLVFDKNKEESFALDLQNIRISKKAMKMIKANDINISVFKEKTIIKTNDVENYLISRQNIPAYIVEKIEKTNYNDADVIVYGAGGHGKMCIDIVKQSNNFNIVGIIDDDLSKINKNIFGIPILGNKKLLKIFLKNNLRQIIIGIGSIKNNAMRYDIYEEIKSSGFNVPNIIHPSAIIEPSVKLGEGIQIMAGAILGSDVKIGDNCIINSGSIVSHDSHIGNNVHITPGAVVGGHCIIGNNTMIGMSATIYLGLSIGKNVIIKNGMNIFSNIKDSQIIK